MLLLDEGLPTLHLGEANISPLFGRRLCGIDPPQNCQELAPLKERSSQKEAPKGSRIVFQSPFSGANLLLVSGKGFR